MIDQGWAVRRKDDATSARDAFERKPQEAESGAALEGFTLRFICNATTRVRLRSMSAPTRHTAKRARPSRPEGQHASWRGLPGMLGDWAVQNGWLARAVRVFTEAGEDTPEHGWLLIIRWYAEPDATVREVPFREAIAAGRRFSDLNLEIEALSSLGSLYLMIDRADEGLGLLDESMAALCAGELNEIATVESLFCGFFWACELVNDVPRADQWMRATSDGMANRNVVAAFAARTTAASSPRPDVGKRPKRSSSTPPATLTGACHSAPRRSSGWPILRVRQGRLERQGNY